MPEVSLNRFIELAKDYAYIPIWADLSGDLDTPVSLVKKLGGCIYLLESVERGESVGRNSFIGFDPLLRFESKGDQCKITCEGLTTKRTGDPLALMAEAMQELNVAPCTELSGFNGGAVGFFGYDLVKKFETLPNITEDDLDLPDCRFVVTKSVIVMDHVTKHLRVVTLAHTGKDPEKGFRSARKYLRSVVNRLQTATITETNQHFKGAVDFKSNVTKEQYMTMVEKGKEYIKAGDIFQVVLSQRLTCTAQDVPFEVYRRLRTINPSPYLYYLELDDITLIGSSPEMLVRVSDGVVETCPIAGTRPRGKTQGEDVTLAQELLADTKERAEHVMLVDLGRNDLGRVCEYGSVNVDKMMEIEQFSHVMHLVSNVKGKLKRGKTAFDVLRGCFPAGTVSGAPKIRAMEIIEELEPTRRGPYAGAIGYVGFGGALDSCITIRTIMIKEDKAYIQAGAGIVADSEPEKEYQETLNKAKALMSALSPDGEGNICF